MVASQQPHHCDASAFSRLAHAPLAACQQQGQSLLWLKDMTKESIRNGSRTAALLHLASSCTAVQAQFAACLECEQHVPEDRLSSAYSSLFP